jgi:thiol-disulfide isomerase/thioredoxin
MRALLSGLLVVALAPAAARSDDKPADKTPARVEFEKLKKEYEAALTKFGAEMRKAQEEVKAALEDPAKKDAEKKDIQKKFMDRALNGPQRQYGLRFLELAKKNPQDPSALEALELALRATGGPFIKNEPYPKVIAAFGGYVGKPEIKRSIRMLASMLDEPSDKVLNDVMAKNPDRKIQAAACKARIQAREGMIQLAGRLKESELARDNLDEVAGKGFADKFIASAAGADKEAKALKKTLGDKYFDIYPAIGKPAPEVVMQGVDGKQGRLSALKGKVVVLDIWATWCGPCRGMIPHEREMVERLKDKPFTLVSISADAEKKTLTDFLAKENMPWTHWWNGNQGGIVEAWEVEHYPTIYVIDAEGVIRHEELRGEELEKAVNDLLKEVGNPKSN